MAKRKANSRDAASLYGSLRRRDFDHIRPIVLKTDDTERDFPNYPEIAKQYAQAVLAKRCLACRYVQLAAKLYLTMLEQAANKRSEFYFSVEHACDFLWFKENLYLGDNFKMLDHADLEPWDIWMHAWIYGFRARGTGERWVSTVYAEIPRKHNKTGSAAALAFYDMGYTKSRAPLIQVGAGSELQADKLFKPMTAIIDNEPDLKEDLKLDYTTKIIRCGKNGGWLEKVATVAKNQDGANPSSVILDELHAQKPDVFQVLTSAFGARSNQILYQITTAGRHASGLAWEQRLEAIKVLEGQVRNSRMVPLIYTVDTEDMEHRAALLTNEKLWFKAMPMLGVSIKLDTIRDEALQSATSPTKREEFYRTRLNIWSNAASALVDMDRWNMCRKSGLALEDFIGTNVPCTIGVDLSTYLDLTAVGFVFELPEDFIAVFCKFYLPRTSPTLLNPVNHASMMDWFDKGELELHDSSTVDYRRIEADIRTFSSVFNVRNIGFDKAMGATIMQNLWDSGLPVLDFPMRPWALTEPTEDLLAHVHNLRCQHDGGGLLSWNMGNVVGDRRTDGTVMPKKETEHSDRKVDGFMALAIANGCRINPNGLKNPKDKEPEDIYLKRGLLGHREDDAERHRDN